MICSGLKGCHWVCLTASFFFSTKLNYLIHFQYRNESIYRSFLLHIHCWLWYSRLQWYSWWISSWMNLFLHSLVCCLTMKYSFDEGLLMSLMLDEYLTIAVTIFQSFHEHTIYRSYNSWDVIFSVGRMIIATFSIYQKESKLRQS